MRTVRSRIKALSLAMIMAVAMLLSVMPTMMVNAAGQFTDLEQYVKTQSYVGDGSNIYYCDLRYYHNGLYRTWEIKPKDSSIYGKIGYYIADFDSDGEDELLTLSIDSEFKPTISIIELVNGEIVESDSKTISRHELGEGGHLNCFIYPMNGELYIGVEAKEYCGIVATGVDYDVVTFSYDNGVLTQRFSDGYIGSIFDEDYETINRYNAKLREAGFDFDYWAVENLYGEINRNYSDLIKGSQKVCGIRKERLATYDDYRAGNNYSEHDYDNFSKITLYNLGNNNSTGDGTMHRFYNKGNGEHFYTASPSEKSWLICTYWDYEGVAWKAPEVSNTPVYRFYNKYTNDHHYTTDVGEKAYLESIEGWNYEGIGWYSDDNRTVPLYRLFNPYALGAGSHHYTKDAGERDYLRSIGWNYEGIAWYGL